MPICPSCALSADTLGAACICGQSFLVRDAALQAPLEDRALLGRMVGGRFVLIDYLGAGAMGMVYEALQIPVGRSVALKVLHPQISAIEDIKERFLREATAAAALNHPHIVTLFDSGIDANGIAYLAMEMVNGAPLADLTPFDHLDRDDTIRVLHQIIQAVAEAHRNDIVHRDLKPENIFLTRVGVDPLFVKILDFGLAKLPLSASRKVTKAGEVFGTPVYMSPEQAQGSSQVGKESDVYALGVLTFELLSGQPPFYHDDPQFVMNAHVNTPPPPLVLRKSLHPLQPLVPLVSQCLAKNPQSRPQDACLYLRLFEETLELQTAQSLLATRPSSTTLNNPNAIPPPVDLSAISFLHRAPSGRLRLQSDPTDEYTPWHKKTRDN